MKIIDIITIAIGVIFIYVKFFWNGRKTFKNDVQMQIIVIFFVILVFALCIQKLIE